MKLLYTGLLFFFSMTIQFAISAEHPTSSLQKEDITAVIKAFHENIELSMPGNSNVYSKTQGQRIVSSFLSKNQITGFSISQQEAKPTQGYVVGKLQSKDKEYRIYYLYKNNNNSCQIHQLRIENIE